MKFAVNIFLNTTATGLAEAFHFAEEHGLDLEQFRAIVDAGQTSSAISRIKLEKMVQGDFSVQAAIFDVLKNNRLIAEEARLSNVASPLLDVCHELYRETLELGHSHEDMAAVLFALREVVSDMEGRFARLLRCDFFGMSVPFVVVRVGCTGQRAICERSTVNQTDIRGFQSRMTLIRRGASSV